MEIIIKIKIGGKEITLIKEEAIELYSELSNIEFTALFQRDVTSPYIKYGVY